MDLRTSSRAARKFGGARVTAIRCGGKWFGIIYHLLLYGGKMAPTADGGAATDGPKMVNRASREL